MSATNEQIAHLLDNLNISANKLKLGEFIQALIDRIAQLEGAAPYSLPAATTSAIGGVKKLAATADTTATDVPGLVSDVNAFFAKARTAGLM
jgi:hypothetical protein